MSDYTLKLLLLTLIIFIINLPFGYLRAGTRKFSVKWFLYIHLPIPIIVLLRIYSDIGFAIYTYPLFVGAFFLGQLAGKKYAMTPRVNNKQ